jgi:ribosomal protein L14
MAQIMAVTGHKSASSVAVYQRVSTKEKQVMGDIITSSVRGEQPSPEILTHFHLLIVMFKFVMVQPWNMGVC